MGFEYRGQLCTNRKRLAFTMDWLHTPLVKLSCVRCEVKRTAMALCQKFNYKSMIFFC